MKLAQFILVASKQIISEWEVFARTCLPAASWMDLDDRRDHIAGMLKAIAVDLDTPQTSRQQAEKSKGNDDAHVDSRTAANSHGVDRAATGYTPVQMVAEFRALRASVLRLWSEAESDLSRAHFEEMTRFNEAVDQLLAESIARYAKDVDRSKDLFLGVLGHDLRNPLGAIMMSATALMAKEESDWPHMKTMARIVKSGTRMDGMIRDLVDFTRTRLGTGIPVVRVDMDMETICRQTVDEITAFHPDCIVQLEASGPLLGQWDTGRIGQMLSNLVGNAYQHGEKNAPVKVAVRGEADDRVVLTVHNQGPVIPRGQLQHIFNPFVRLEPDHASAGAGASEHRSLGLGLYIAQAVVNAHHGTIHVASTEQGTTFTVRLPRRILPV